MKKILLISLFTFFFATNVYAEEKDLPPAIMGELAMAEQLYQMGKARGEPMMILASVRMRATLGGKTGSSGEMFTTQKEAIAEARKLAKGNKALIGIIEDVAAQGSRRMCIYARNGVCY